MRTQKLKIYLIDYLINENKNMKDKIEYNWIETREILDNSIAKILNETFSDLFINLTKYEYNKNEYINLNNYYSEKTNFLDYKEEKLFSLIYNIESLNISYGFSIDLVNKYNFSIIGYAKTDINISNKFDFNNNIIKEKKDSFYQAILFNATFILSDKSVEVKVILHQIRQKIWILLMLYRIMKIIDLFFKIINIFNIFLKFLEINMIKNRNI